MNWIGHELNKEAFSDSSSREYNRGKKRKMKKENPDVR